MNAGHGAGHLRGDLEELTEVAEPLDRRLQQVAQRGVDRLEVEARNAVVRRGAQSPISSRYHL
jgi:hypothetical protein